MRMSIAVAFAGNEIAIQGGLMASEYGVRPSVLMDAPGGRMARFRFDRAVFNATSQFKRHQRDQARERAESEADGPTSASTTQAEKDAHIEKLNRRANAGEQGDPVPTAGDQHQTLEAKLAERKQARDTAGGTSAAEPQRDQR